MHYLEKLLDVDAYNDDQNMMDNIGFLSNGSVNGNRPDTHQCLVESLVPVAKKGWMFSLSRLLSAAQPLSTEEQRNVLELVVKERQRGLPEKDRESECLVLLAQQSDPAIRHEISVRPGIPEEVSQLLVLAGRSTLQMEQEQQPMVTEGLSLQ